jgi:hypothetical protein
MEVRRDVFHAIADPTCPLLVFPSRVTNKLYMLMIADKKPWK